VLRPIMPSWLTARPRRWRGEKSSKCAC
jgi:hypothetical protein